MITLIGHGYVGSAIARELMAQSVKFHWAHHDGGNGGSLHFNPPQPDAIINAAGFTGNPNVDECERRRAETIAGSIVFPLNLERSFAGVPIVHISSGCVYNGYKPGGWTEEDRPNFDFTNGSFYSGVKALEQDVLDLQANYLLRIRLPFGRDDHPKNYLTKLKKYERLIDVRNSLSCVEDVAKTAVHFAIYKPPPGIYNVVNRGDVMTRDVATIMGLRKPWFTEDEFRTAVVAPRSNCTLSTEKLERIMPVRNVADALREAIA